MSDALQMARDMVDAGFYDEARKIIQQIEHPQKEVWLEEIAKVETTGNYQGTLFSRSPVKLVEALVKPIQRVDIPSPWDILNRWHPSSTELAFILLFSPILLFPFIIAAPFILIPFWSKLERPNLVWVYGAVCAFIFVSALLSAIFPYFGFVVWAYFPFLAVLLMHQSKVHEQLTGFKPIYSRMTSSLSILFIVIFACFAIMIFVSLMNKL